MFITPHQESEHLVCRCSAIFVHLFNKQGSAQQNGVPLKENGGPDLSRALDELARVKTELLKAKQLTLRMKMKLGFIRRLFEASL